MMESTSSQTILLVNRFFHPDISATGQMVSDLAFQLAASGCKLAVVTSRLRYDDSSARLPAFEVINGVEINRVWTSRFGRSTLAGRLADYLTFYLTAPLKVFSIARRGDVVIAKTDPPLISVPVLFAAWLCGARRVNWLQDVFPEVATALGMTLGGSLPRALFTFLRNVSVRTAHCNVAIGHRMADHISERIGRVPIAVVANWLPTHDVIPLPRSTNPLALKWGLNDHFVVGYSGNLGRAHELAVLLKAAVLLKHRHDIAFVIIGDGNQKSVLLEQAAHLNLNQVAFKPYQPQDKLKYSLSLPDVHLVSLKSVLEGFIVPSKFYGCIAAGRPVLFVGAEDGEIARDIQRGNCGVVVPPDNPTLLAEAILRLADSPQHTQELGYNARKLFEAEYSREVAFAKWKDVLDRVSN